MKISETILLCFFTVFAGVLLFNSLAMPYFSGQGFGAGFLPLNMAAAVIILAGMITLRSLLNRKNTHAEHRETTTNSDQDFAEEKQKSLAAPVITIILLLAACAIMRLGSVLLPLAIVLTIISALFLGNTWFRSIRMTIVTLTVIYLIFSVWLDIPVI